MVENSGGEQIDTLNLGGQLVSSRDRKPPPVAMLVSLLNEKMGFILLQLQR